MMGLFLLLAGWNLLLLVEYKIGLAFNDSNYCWAALKNLFSGEVRWLRSSSWLAVLNHFDFSWLAAFRAIDWLFVLGLPLMMIFLLTACCVFAGTCQNGLGWQMKWGMILAYFVLILGVSLIFMKQNPAFQPQERATRYGEKIQLITQFAQYPKRNRRYALAMSRFVLDLDPKSESLQLLALQTTRFLLKQAQDLNFSEEAQWYGQQLETLQSQIRNHRLPVDH